MQTSKAFKLQHGSCCSMLVTGSFQSFPQPCPASTQPLFVALCTPTVNRLRGSDSHLCHSFSSVHALDMTFTQLSDRYIYTPQKADQSKLFSWPLLTDVFALAFFFFFSVVYFLGYSAAEMIGRSWYSLVHPEELSPSADSHRSLSKCPVHCRKTWTLLHSILGSDKQLQFPRTNFFFLLKNILKLLIPTEMTFNQGY